MVGIKNLKRAVKFAIDVTNQFIEAMADGKFTVFESFGFIDELSQIPGVVNSASEVLQEVKDLSEEEKNELTQYVVDELHIPSEKVEDVIAKSISFAFATNELVAAIKGVKKE